VNPGDRSLGDLLGYLSARGFLRGVVVPEAAPVEGTTVTSVALDSRLVAPGGLFVAVPGARADGHDFVSAAVAAGACAVVVERPLQGVPVPQVVVESARPALAAAAAWVEGFPSRDLCVIGVTGTDGKTTTSFLARGIIEAAGLPCGLVGTVERVVGGRRDGEFVHTTTPEAPELQAELAAMVAAGDRAVVIESTSHGLAQDRVGEIAYDVALVTNLTHEHLEFHRTHEAYRAAKRRLFEALTVSDANPEKGWGKTGIVNVDDAWAGEFADATRHAGARLVTYAGSRLVTYAGAGLPGGEAAGIRLAGIEERSGGFLLDVATSRWRGPVGLRLAGRFNAANALAAIAIGEALGLDPASIRSGIESIDRVTGRMERVESDAPFTVMVDFAHTPHSLQLVLDELAPLAMSGGGGLIAVFGSAGERDTVKRPIMGRVAAERCRLTVVTDEDPRGEDRVAICEEIAAGAESAGARRGESLLVIPDRGEAIAAAFERARPGDVVVLAGKGHERTIEMAGGDLPWNERAVAETFLRARGWQAR